MRTPAPTAVTSACDLVLADDFPELAADRRRIVSDFVVTRLGVLPGPMKLGVTVIASMIAVLRSVAGDSVVIRLSHRPFPLIGEYFRLLRSLSYAYIWETWPATTPTGGTAPNTAGEHS